MSHRRPLRQGQLSTFQTLKGQWVWSLMKGAGAAGGHREGGQGFRKRYKAIPYPQSSGKLLSFYVGVTRAPISGLKVHAGNSVESSLLGGGVERETVRRLWSSPGVLGWALAVAIGSLSDV